MRSDGWKWGGILESSFLNQGQRFFETIYISSSIMVRGIYLCNLHHNNFSRSVITEQYLHLICFTIRDCFITIRSSEPGYIPFYWVHSHGSCSSIRTWKHGNTRNTDADSQHDKAQWNFYKPSQRYRVWDAKKITRRHRSLWNMTTFKIRVKTGLAETKHKELNMQLKKLFADLNANQWSLMHECLLL